MKKGRLDEFLKAQRLDGVVLKTRANFAWLTCGGDSHVVAGSDVGIAAIVATKGSARILTTNIESARLADEELVALPIEVESYPWHDSAAAEAALKRAIGADQFAADVPLAGAKPLPGSFAEMTYTLTDPEIERYRLLGKECAGALESVCMEAEPGRTEHQVAAELSRGLRSRGIRPHVVLVASDERVFKYRHPIPTRKKIKEHLLAVICGERWGLILSTTRLVHFGKLPEELAEKHRAVIAVDAALNGATRAGREVREVFAEGLAAYRRTGYPDEWRLHHQGGPTGYQGRSYFGSPAETRRVLSPQAFAWNPSITGTKSEDTIVVAGDEREFLSSPGRSWPKIEGEWKGEKLRRADILVR